MQVARERRLRKVSEQAAEAAADSVDAERHRLAARAAQEAAYLHLKVPTQVRAHWHKLHYWPHSL